MMQCRKCDDTGIFKTGNNDLPCDCPAGDTALFSQAGVVGSVTGVEMRRHFLNNSPDPIEIGETPILASGLPGRQELERRPVHETIAEAEAAEAARAEEENG